MLRDIENDNWFFVYEYGLVVFLLHVGLFFTLAIPPYCGLMKDGRERKRSHKDNFLPFPVRHLPIDAVVLSPQAH